jgi:hypothetical protein
MKIGLKKKQLVHPFMFEVCNQKLNDFFDLFYVLNSNNHLFYLSILS